MEAITGLSGVILLVVCLYVFRANLKQFNKQAPQVVSNLMNTAVKGSIHLDSVISANGLETELDCARRIKVVEEAFNQEQLSPSYDAYERIMRIKL